MDDLKVEAKVLPALPQGLKAIPGVGVRRHHAPQVAALKMEEGLMDFMDFGLKFKAGKVKLLLIDLGLSENVGYIPNEIAI